ncbi:LysR family transcriptional regulator [Solimonas soli]|uniref:LysR family transcriptional regulator n=1 Tax=Solimonas soli TaxID=413479 RepID=UPI000485D699|nr:LysR family transcriptional regulator [Solimonas soli]
MNPLREIETFIQVAQRGSLSAAARALDLTPAMVGRRIDALEARLGVRLMTRTTRSLTLSAEGTAFLEDCQRIVEDLAAAEANVSRGSMSASGQLRITAPAGFGRRHVAPAVAAFLEQHPDVDVSLDLSDRISDLANENIDCAIRVGELTDSRLVRVHLADNRRVVVASPAYLKRRGTPKHPDEISQHDCLSLGDTGGQARGWSFVVAGELRSIKPHGRFDCNDGAVLHEWALAGRGLAWRSMWEVGDDLAAGRLVEVLHDYAAPPNGIYALFLERRHLPLRTRLFVEFLKQRFGDAAYWRTSTPVR